MTSLWVMYLFSYMVRALTFPSAFPPFVCSLTNTHPQDRSNIGNAKIAGMNDDLGLTDEEYSLAIVVFIVGYILGQVPSKQVTQMQKENWGEKASE